MPSRKLVLHFLATKLGSQNQVVYNMIRRIMNGYNNDDRIKHWKPLAVVNEVDDDELEYPKRALKNKTLLVN